MLSQKRGRKGSELYRINGKENEGTGILSGSMVKKGREPVKGGASFGFNEEFMKKKNEGGGEKS